MDYRRDVMTPQQIEILRETWHRVLPIGDAAAELFYSRLFEIDPSVKPLFAKVAMPQQREKLLQTLNSVIEAIDDLDAVVPAIRDLGRRHVGYGVTEAQYDSVGEALLWTLEKGLGESWAEEAAEAWTSAYALIATTMIEAANEAPTAGNGKVVA